MQAADGKQGLVPVNYIDKLDLPEGQANSVSPGNMSPSDGGSNARADSNPSLPFSSSTHSKSSLREAPPEEAPPEEALDEVSSMQCGQQRCPSYVERLAKCASQFNKKGESCFRFLLQSPWQYNARTQWHACSGTPPPSLPLPSIASCV